MKSESQERRAAIAMDPDEFARVGHALVDRVSDLIRSLPERPVTPGEAPHVVRDLIDAERPIPEEGASAEELLRTTAELLSDHSLFNGHPRFFGYITASPAPIGILADFLAAAVNPNVGAWQLAPIASEIEAQTVRWIADLIGYPRTGSGLLVTGGNMANFVGLFAARVAGARWDVRRLGLRAEAARPLRIYASGETHTWVQKAADLSGVGTEAIRWIPTDGGLRMDVGALRDAMRRDREAGDDAMLVVGTAGSVSTGAVDPLPAIAEVCRSAGAWFHVDGAYGALAAKVPGAPAELAGLALADSVAVDPHKWLYTPLEAGCVLTRDPDVLRNAFSYHPPYYFFGEAALNFVDFGPQNSRGFRALKVWLQLRHVGRAGYLEMIGEDIRLSERLFARVAEHPELEAVTQMLSIATFRYVPPDLRARRDDPEVAAYLDTLSDGLLDRIQRSGEAFVSNAVVGGRRLLRACIVNFRTSEADVDALPEIVARLGREVDGTMRKGASPPTST